MTDSTDVLLKAIDMLGEKGWCQGEVKNTEGQMCTIGAVRYSAQWLTGEWDSHLATHALQRLMSHLWGDDDGVYEHTIPYWNDQPERTAEDVILALKRTAAGE